MTPPSKSKPRKEDPLIVHISARGPSGRGSGGGRVGGQYILREKGYLYYLGKDGYLWKTPTKLNKSGKKSRVGTEKITRQDGYMYFLDKKGFVSRAKMKNA